MAIRSLLLFLAGAASGTLAVAEDTESSGGVATPMLIANWSGPESSPADTTPAICIGKENWFISIVPHSIALDGLKAPKLHRGDEIFASTILHFDSTQRLCLLSSDKKISDTKPVSLSKAHQVRPGKALHCRSENGTCRTTVAGKDRYYLGKPLPAPLLRVRVEDAEHFCHPGMPLFNEKEELEGILTEQDLITEMEAYAITAAQLTKLIQDFEQFQRSGPIWIGLLFHTTTSTPEVLEVREDSPASDAGVDVGDIILQLDGRRIENFEELTGIIFDLPAGRETKMVVLRGLEKVDLTIIPRFADEKTASSVVPNR